jgi:hypothetical protein
LYATPQIKLIALMPPPESKMVVQLFELLGGEKLLAGTNRGVTY